MGKKGFIGALYELSRLSGKTASKLNTAKTIMSGNPEKIVKHIARKEVYKASNKIARKINGKLK